MSRRQDILDIQKVYTEAMDLSMVRKYKMSSKDSNAYKLPQISDVFNGKHRLVYNLDLDYGKSFAKSTRSADSSYNKVVGFLDKLGYEQPGVKDYIEGIVYKAGDKNVYKIGRILARHEEEQPQVMTPKNTLVPQYSAEFKNDPIRHIKGQDYVIVISRHPYDLYGMSTDRMWTSCMDMNKKNEGNKSHMIAKEVEKGTLIAYLTPKSELNESGKVSLIKPVSRVLLKPMYNDEGELAYGFSTVYGGVVDSFNDFVHEWVDKNFNSKVKNTKGFSLAHGVYEDPYEMVGGVEEASTKKRAERQLLHTLNDVRDEMLPLIPANIRSGVKFVFNIEDINDIHCNINIIFRDSSVEVVDKINKRADSNKLKAVTKKYNIWPLVYENDYFYDLLTNPTDKSVKIRFYAVGETVYDIIKFMKWFIEVPAQLIKI